MRPSAASAEFMFGSLSAWKCPVADAYRFWRRLDNLPQFMTHLNRVTTTADGKSHWEAAGPGGLAVEWDAENHLMR